MQNVYSQYKEQAVTTMTQAEMLVCLYDEAIKRLKRAKLLLDAKDFDNFEAETLRAREIVSYLDQTLDNSFEVSASLHKLYDFFSVELVRAQTGHRAEPIDGIVPLLEELRGTWKEADKLSRNG